MGKKSNDLGRINGLIDKGCSMEGKLTFDGTVQINGSFRGDIISDGTLIVGPEACVEGTLNVGNIVSDGTVQGTLKVSGKAEFRAGSRLVADVFTPSVYIEDGAVFHGRCYMLDEANAVDFNSSDAKPDVEMQDGQDAMIM